MQQPSTEQASRWRALYRCDDLGKARVVATCLAAMEYDVRLMAMGVPIDELSDEQLAAAPFEVRVVAADWPQLVEVLEEIIDEQEQFDEIVESLGRRITRNERRLLFAMIVIVGALAAAGAIDL